jgi:hypothetical protein
MHTYYSSIFPLILLSFCKDNCINGVKGHAEERFVEKNVGRETLNRDFTSITKNTENINSISNVTWTQSL